MYIFYIFYIIYPLVLAGSFGASVGVNLRFAARKVTGFNQRQSIYSTLPKHPHVPFDWNMRPFKYLGLRAILSEILQWCFYFLSPGWEVQKNVTVDTSASKALVLTYKFHIYEWSVGAIVVNGMYIILISSKAFKQVQLWWIFCWTAQPWKLFSCFLNIFFFTSFS